MERFASLLSSAFAKTSKNRVLSEEKLSNVSKSKNGFVICLKPKSIDSKRRKKSKRLFQVVRSAKMVSKSLSL